MILEIIRKLEPPIFLSYIIPFKTMGKFHSKKFFLFPFSVMSVHVRACVVCVSSMALSLQHVRASQDIGVPRHTALNQGVLCFPPGEGYATKRDQHGKEGIG